MADALHVTGVVSAQEARVNDGGLIAVQGPTALDVRTGVMTGPGSTALVTGTSATAPMTVQIAPHHWVTSRGSANGPYRGTNEITRTATIAAAPGSGSRVDVVWVKMMDNTVGVPSPDVSVGELYGVITGTVGAGKPVVPPGVEELATVTVASGATATNGAGVTIANTARQTAARGGIIPVRNQAERDAVTVYPATVFRIDTGNLETHGLTGGWSQVPYATDTGWTNTGIATVTGTPVTVAADGSRYRVKNGICYVQTHFAGSRVYGADHPFYTLPAAARPAYTQWFTAHWFDSTPFELVAYPSGLVACGPIGSNGASKNGGVFSASWPAG